MVRGAVLALAVGLGAAWCQQGTGGSSGDDLFAAGKFAEAAEAYRGAIKASPEAVNAQAGLVRALLRLDRPDEANEVATKALATHPGAATLLAEMGDVHFRRGEMSEAEGSYIAAYKADKTNAHALWGLARLYGSYSLHRKAYDLRNAAHQLAPNDPEIRRAWLNQLPRRDRVKALEEYLAGPHPDDEEQTENLRLYLAFLKATVDKPVHACKLISKVDKTETKLQALRQSANHTVAAGMMVGINDKKAKLELDTGASGIVIGSRLAEQAGLTRISDSKFGGAGDKGRQSGYVAHADKLTIGELEFHDCVVEVSDKKNIIDRDGLIGADVFDSYLIDIDLPGERMLLTPLPKRPDDVEQDKSLNSGGDEESSAKEEGEGEQKPAAVRKIVLPKDRYVAPEMANWSRIFHFGHLLLIPTIANDKPKPMLFLIDTGAFGNTLTLKAARQVGKPYEDPYIHVHGLSGSVEHVYRVDGVKLQFGRFVSPSQSYVSFNMDSLSRNAGTEVSGTLGFEMLRMLEVKIDYRDGLVDFTYDRNRVRPE